MAEEFLDAIVLEKKDLSGVGSERIEVWEL